MGAGGPPDFTAVAPVLLSERGPPARAPSRTGSIPVMMPGMPAPGTRGAFYVPVVMIPPNPQMPHGVRALIHRAAGRKRIVRTIAGHICDARPPREGQHMCRYEKCNDDDVSGGHGCRHGAGPEQAMVRGSSGERAGQ